MQARLFPARIRRARRCRLLCAKRAQAYCRTHHAHLFLFHQVRLNDHHVDENKRDGGHPDQRVERVPSPDRIAVFECRTPRLKLS